MALYRYLDVTFVNPECVALWRSINKNRVVIYISVAFLFLTDIEHKVESIARRQFDACRGRDQHVVCFVLPDALSSLPIRFNSGARSCGEKALGFER